MSIFTPQERSALLFAAAVTLGGLLALGWAGRIPGSGPPPFSSVRLQVRVNAASAAELTALPGIGPVLAERIVKERQARGRYLTLEDLKRVKGISRKLLEQIRGSVRFD